MACCMICKWSHSASNHIYATAKEGEGESHKSTIEYKTRGNPLARMWVCAVLGGFRQGVAGCCVLCFLFCDYVVLLTLCILCSCYFVLLLMPLVLYAPCCIVLLDVSSPPTRMVQLHHHENPSQHSCSSDETQCIVPEQKHNSKAASRFSSKHHEQPN